MAIIQPFRGVRYDEKRIGDLSAVVAPPYDVITPEDEDYYRDRHPNNVVRLILPREDSVGDKYSNAVAILNEWLAEGILVQDNHPCLYACLQEYVLNGVRKRRLGFTCLVRIEDFSTGVVVPHEHIMPKPLEDRLKLIRATRANFDSVFGLYAGGDVREMLEPFLDRTPDASAVDRDQVRCDIWRVSDRHVIRSIANIIERQSVVIADGHHRYSAALAYRNEIRDMYGMSNPDAPSEYVMMTLVSFDDPGLVVLPTHRLIRGIAELNPDRFIRLATEFFDVHETSTAELEKEVSLTNGVRTTFGVYLGSGKSYVIRLKPNVMPEKVVEMPGSEALKRLDVSVLHGLILEKMLGIGRDQVARGDKVTFTRDIEASLRLVDSGLYQMLIVMNPTKVEEIKAVTSSGERLPQKSTFFYPKLLTGMVMRVME